MTSAFEFGVEPQQDEFVDGAIADHVAGQAEHVDVVVASSHFDHDFFVAGSRANAGKLVGRDRHSQAAAADQDAAIGFSAADFAGYDGGNIGIVAGGRGRGTLVTAGEPVGF